MNDKPRKILKFNYGDRAFRVRTLVLTVDVAVCDFENIFEMGRIPIVTDAPPVNKLDPTDHVKGGNSSGDQKTIRIARPQVRRVGHCEADRKME
jgi:hypothetical protein